MSYILDALRRADAQRQRAAVPGLHDQPATLGTAARQPLPRSVPLAWVLLALALLMLLALAAWWWQAALVRSPGPATSSAIPAPAPESRSSAAAASAPRPGPAAVTLAAPAPAPLPPAVAPRAAVTSTGTGTTTVTVTVNGPAATAPTQVAVVAAPAATARAPKAVPGTEITASAGEPLAALPAAARLSADTRVPPLASLPEALRRQLPPLALGGGMYAEQPAQRLVLVNGQVAHEGDDLGRGLRLLQIRPRSVVFAFGEQMFELAL